MTMRFTGDNASPHGLFAATRACQHQWTVQGTFVTLDVGFVPSLLLSILLSHYCIWQARAWFTGSDESYIEYNSRHWGLLGSRLDKQARRQRRGHCPQCNYNLLFDLKSGCPECGWGRKDAEG